MTRSGELRSWSLPGPSAICSSTMCRLILVLIVIAVATRPGRAFYINWSPVQYYHKGFHGSTRDNEIEKEVTSHRHKAHYELPPLIPPNEPLAVAVGSIFLEDNKGCSNFACDKKPCCSGLCIDMFGSQICVDMSDRKR